MKTRLRRLLCLYALLLCAGLLYALWCDCTGLSIPCFFYIVTGLRNDQSLPAAADIGFCRRLLGQSGCNDFTSFYIGLSDLCFRVLCSGKRAASQILRSYDLGLCYRAAALGRDPQYSAYIKSTSQWGAFYICRSSIPAEFSACCTARLPQERSRRR